MRTMERSSPERLAKEVLSKEIGAALPCNLPDEWIDLLERDLDMILNKDDQSYLTAPLAIICHIIFDKSGRKDKKVAFTEEELFKYIQYLYFEITLETVRRHTDVAPAPATLETILTNREVGWDK